MDRTQAIPEPSFDPRSAPIGSYVGDDLCELAYRIKPRPAHATSWTNLFQARLTAELQPVLAQDAEAADPQIEITIDHIDIHCAVRVPMKLTIDDLCAVDDAVYNAICQVNDDFRVRQAALDDKLEAVRKRRSEQWLIGSVIDRSGREDRF
jgi:hypothetical protein